MLTKEQQELINQIHEIATSDDHYTVRYSKDNQIMLKQVVENCDKKLSNIADLLQVLAED